MQNPWSQNAKTYDEAQGETGDVAHKLLFDPAIEKVLGDVTGETILDAGCGNGYWVRRLAKYADHVVGIDESSELIAIAKDKDNPGNVEFRVMDLNKKLDLENETFDLVLSSMVFHYLPSLFEPAAELRRVLKKGGKIVLCVQHPSFQYHFRAQEKAGKKSGKFLSTASYFDRTPVEQVTLFGKVTVHTYNRPMEDYIDPFLKNGFTLTAFSEPEYTPEMLEQNPQYQEIREVPRVVIMGFTKI